MDYQNSNSKIILLRVLFFLFVSYLPQLLSAQRSDDLGLFVGGSSYMGDVNPNRLIYKPSLALGVNYRYNYNPVFSMKYAAKYGRLRANDLDFANIYQQLRGYSFNHTIFEASALVEYNFFPITMEKTGRDKFTPYVNFGVSLAYCNRTIPNFHPSIPFGVGLKYRISRKIELGVEWIFRRTFTDKLDGVPIYYDLIARMYKGRQMAFVKTRDWYSFYGITLHYCLRKTGFKCPAYNDKR